MCFVGLYESSFCSSHSFDCSIDIGQLVRFTILRSGPHYLVSSRSCSSELSWIPPRMYIWNRSSLIACVRNGYTRQYGFTIASGRAYLQYTKFQILSCLRQVLALSRTCALHGKDKCMARNSDPLSDSCIPLVRLQLNKTRMALPATLDISCQQLQYRTPTVSVTRHTSIVYSCMDTSGHLFHDAATVLSRLTVAVCLSGFARCPKGRLYHTRMCS